MRSILSSSNRIIDVKTSSVEDLEILSSFISYYQPNILHLEVGFPEDVTLLSIKHFVDAVESLRTKVWLIIELIISKM